MGSLFPGPVETGEPRIRYRKKEGADEPSPSSLARGRVRHCRTAAGGRIASHWWRWPHPPSSPSFLAPTCLSFSLSSSPSSSSATVSALLENLLGPKKETRANGRGARRWQRRRRRRRIEPDRGEVRPGGDGARPRRLHRGAAALLAPRRSPRPLLRLPPLRPLRLLRSAPSLPPPRCSPTPALASVLRSDDDLMPLPMWILNRAVVRFKI